ncbi:MAG: DsbA family oxidoreductase [Pseudomonadota bacterium]
MPTVPLKIDFVSDVACPWCAVGLGALEEALRRTGDAVPVELRFEPFELNPDMDAEGKDATAYMTQKYGSTPEQQASARANIAARGAEVGFTFKPEGRGRIWNTFDAHRLLYWADVSGSGKQHALKKALLVAYHGRAERIGEHAVLEGVAAEVGLDAAEARAILASDRYTDEVRAREQHWQQLGIHAVPSVVINGRHLIQGGQPPEAFEQALRKIAAAEAGAETTA